ncbi:DUF3089 domain-containing protein [Novosphingobium sediminicola]|uniref:DUF3089 domain-containing protein n=1 Tax=Novosphingobium sediminicola TaxID=563162 RepID=UPI00160A77CC|nr:DUF3089 domain-containing protein [Novosphingobium sediminicola]
MARKFVYGVAILVVLVIGALGALRYWAKELTQFTFVPVVPFSAAPPLAANAYADPSMWYSRGAGGPNDPSRWRPNGAPVGEATLPVAVFFIHPTSHFDRLHWNSAIDETLISGRTEILLRGLATPFSAAAEVWAPRYRQATLGAFLTDRPSGRAALDVAYGDVLAAFDEFIAQVDPRLPIVIAGHSQGAFHLMHLMQDRVAGKPLAARVAAAYAVGWPVSLDHDLPEMGLPACEGPDQAGCVISWQSFAEPAETDMVREAYARFPGLDGAARGDSPFLCINPITGRPGDASPAQANPGTLVPDGALTGASVIPGLVPARCAPDGFLMIGPAPQLGPFVAPGNNFHVYDIPLFWSALRADVARRVKAWHGAPPARAARKAPDAQTEQTAGWWRQWLS